MESGAWRPVAEPRVLQARAALLGQIRSFFQGAGVLEVETPACSRYAPTDPAIDSLQTCYRGPGQALGLPLYLHTSPEFPMKRLLAAGIGPIYQICKVFRDGERGRLHHPEFSLLEWYRPGFDSQRLMDEVAALIRHLAGTDLAEQRLTYGQLFQTHLGLDPHSAGPGQLQAEARRLGIAGADQLDLPDRDAWLDLLLSHYIEPRLDPRILTFVHQYPASQASLARVRPGPVPVAERFELYLGGMELANGFHERADPDEQRRRFLADLERRGALGRAQVPLDAHLLEALAAGLPDCSGVALGLDRLLMWLTGSRHIDQVLAFPLERA